MSNCLVMEIPPRLPDASASADVVRQDISSLADVGAGGLEFLPFYLYGLPTSGAVPPTDWNKYGFGTQAFRDIFKVALTETKTKSLVMDFAIGANQGQGLAVELVFGNASVAAGQTFNGPPPTPNINFWVDEGFMADPEKFGPNILKAVIAGRVVSSNGGLDSNHPVQQTVLGESSIVDLTSLSENWTLNWTAPTSNGTHRVIAFYEKYTNQRACKGGVNATNYIGNGSWIVDHFSADGAARTTDFLDQHLINGDVKKLVSQVGNYSWEDSMEQQASLFWTPDFLDNFAARRGYSAIKYLPLFFSTKNQWGQVYPPYNETFIYGQYDSNGESVHITDYRLTLNEGYQDYINHLNLWSRSIGINYSCQPAYNLPLEMLADTPTVAVPELESLGLKNIARYRQFNGPAHLNQMKIISTEVGGESTGAYEQTVPQLLALFRNSFAAGVNMMVVHGSPYSGDYAETTWPGYTPFYYTTTDMWNRKQPAWKHFKDIMDFTARNQLVLQTGTARTDLAFYLYEAPWTGTNSYQPDNLRAQGYTYEYLGPENLLSAHAVVNSSILAPDGPAYKALIFSNATQISFSVIDRINHFAAFNLPVIFIGRLPTDSIGYTANGGLAVSQLLNTTLSQHKSVRQISDSSELSAALEAAGISPRASFTSPSSSWYSFWRSDTKNKQKLVYLFNGGDAKTVDINFTVASNAVPFILDTWTGDQLPLLQYNRTKSGISAPIHLRTNQSFVIAFTQNLEAAAPSVHVESTSGGVVDLLYSQEAGIEVRTTSLATVTLQDGKSFNLNGQAPAPLNLTR
ncbi:MAG: hypothetical protein M1834_005929 [Cirrosporium novae-zelandiae]|nr:MAG: hypothetical protein M1834_005929 [Cirrosporium novae-zelandiae]